MRKFIVILFCVISIVSCRNIDQEVSQNIFIQDQYVKRKDTSQKSETKSDFSVLNWQGLIEQRIFLPQDYVYPFISNDLVSMEVYYKNESTGNSQKLQYRSTYKCMKLMLSELVSPDGNEICEYFYDDLGRIIQLSKSNASEINSTKETYHYFYSYDKKNKAVIRIMKKANGDVIETWSEFRKNNSFKLVVKKESQTEGMKPEDDNTYFIEFKNKRLNKTTWSSPPIVEGNSFLFTYNDKGDCQSILEIIITKDSEIRIQSFEITGYNENQISEITCYEYDRGKPQKKIAVGKIILSKFDKNGNWQCAESYDKDGKKNMNVCIRVFTYLDE